MNAIPAGQQNLHETVLCTWAAAAGGEEGPGDATDASNGVTAGRSLAESKR